MGQQITADARNRACQVKDVVAAQELARMRPNREPYTALLSTTILLSHPHIKCNPQTSYHILEAWGTLTANSACTPAGLLRALPVRGLHVYSLRTKGVLLKIDPRSLCQ